MFLLLLACCLLSLHALLRASRGQIIDHHPLCRHCTFDLTGLPATSTRCPECGSDIRASTSRLPGHRHRNPALLSLTLAVFLSSVVAFSILTYSKTRHTNFLQYEPSWFLLHRLNSNTYSTAPIADELLTRLTTGQLSPSQISSISDIALSVQRHTAAPQFNLTLANKFLETACQTHQMDQPHALLFFRQAMTITFQARPIVRQGDTLPILLKINPVQLADADFGVFVDLDHVELDGRRIQNFHPFASWSGHQLCGLVSPTSSVGDTRTFDPSNTRSLPPGKHRIQAAVHAYVYTWDYHRYYNSSRRSSLDPAELLGSFVTNVQSSFDLYDADHEPSLFKTDPAIASAMHACVKISSVSKGSVDDEPVVWIPFQIDSPPFDLCFDFLVQPAGKDEPRLWSRSYEGEFAGGGTTFVSLPAFGTLGDEKYVDITLIPNSNGSRNWPQHVYVWGDRLEYKHIRVDPTPWSPVHTRRPTTTPIHTATPLP